MKNQRIAIKEITMIRMTSRVAAKTQTSAEVCAYLRQTIIQFWRFSQFHGRYQSLSLNQRQQLIDTSKSKAN